MLLSLSQLASVPIQRCVLRCHFSLSQPLVKTSETWVYCLFPPRWRLWGFLCGFMWGTVFSHVCKCRCSDVNSVLLYMCVSVCVCELALSSWISRESRQYTPYCNTSHCDTHSKVWYTECSPLPFYTSLFSFTEYFLLLLNTLFFCRRLHFIGTTLLRGCFSKGHKLVIIQSWKSLLDQWMLLPQSLSFILESSFSF